MSQYWNYQVNDSLVCIIKGVWGQPIIIRIINVIAWKARHQQKQRMATFEWMKSPASLTIIIHFHARHSGRLSLASAASSERHWGRVGVSKISICSVCARVRVLSVGAGIRWGTGTSEWRLILKPTSQEGWKPREHDGQGWSVGTVA